MRKLATMTLALLLCAGTAQAQMAPAAKTPLKPIFLSGDALTPALLLPTPPKPDSVAGKADLDAVRAAIKAASPERIKQAAADDGNESIALFTSVVPGLDLAKLPATAKLFKDVENDQNYATKQAKSYFARVRPFDLDHSIPTCVPSAFGKAPTSYPSGHSTLGFTDGIILAHLIPAKAEAIFVRAQDYAYSRVVCGVHFETDAVASQSLASGIAVELLQNAEFQKEFAAAKAELVTAGLTQ